jgi:hypothetical protein
VESKVGVDAVPPAVDEAVEDGVEEPSGALEEDGAELAEMDDAQSDATIEAGPDPENGESEA